MNFLKLGKLITKKKDPNPKHLFLYPNYLSASLVNGNFKKLVALPKYVDLNEWLATNSRI